MTTKTPEQARLEAGLNLSEVAELAGASTQTVSRMETGDTVQLRGVTLQKIGRVLSERLKAKGETYGIPDYIAGCIAVRDARQKEKKKAVISESLIRRREARKT